jgi:two-component system chemotaxis response regulator CheY
MDREQARTIIVDAVHEVFETLVYVFPEETPPDLSIPAVFEKCLVSTVDFSGGVRGTITMLCSMKMGETLARDMLGITDDDELGAGVVPDSAGEIVNMVAGRIKDRLVQYGLDLKLSIPNIAFPGTPAPPPAQVEEATKVDFLVDGEPVTFLLFIEEAAAAPVRHPGCGDAIRPGHKEIPSMNRLLIVDDSSTMRKIIARSLRQAGFPIGEIVEAENGQAGLDKLQTAPMGMVLTDINMPVMDGLRFIEAVRANPVWEKMPIIVITTEGSEGVTKESIKRGANNIVKKPFTPEQIREKLQHYFA